MMTRTRFLFSAVWLCGLVTFAEAHAIEVSLEDAERLALASSKDLSLLSKEDRVKDLELDLAQSAFRPEVSASGGYTREDTADENRQGPLFKLGATWNVYRGGLDTSQMNVLRQEKKGVALASEKTRIAIISDVRILFYSAQSLVQKMSLIENEIISIGKLKKSARQRIAAGLATSTDELEFQLREQELQSDLSSTRSEHESYINQLRALTRVPKTETFTLVASKKQRNGPRPQGSNLTSNVERRILETEKEVLAVKRSQISGAYKPSVSVFADVGKITPEPLDSKARLESVVGVNVSVPLYDGGQRSNREQIAAIEMTKVDDQLEKVSVQLQTTLNSVEIEEKNLRDAEVINQRRLESAEKYLRSTMDEYQRGVKNSPDALSSTERLFAAKLKKIDLTLQRDLLDVKKFSIIGQSQ